MMFDGVFLAYKHFDYSLFAFIFSLNSYFRGTEPILLE